MIREIDGKYVFWQLDFKHVFGHKTRVDARPIAVPEGLRKVLERTGRWQEVKMLCSHAFLVLRRSAPLITQMSRALFVEHGGTRDDDVQRYLQHAFMLHATEVVAAAELVEEVETSSGSISKRFKDLTHDISMAQKAKAKERAESNGTEALVFQASLQTMDSADFAQADSV